MSHLSDCRDGQQSEREKVGILGRRFTFHNAFHINTRHGITCFHTLPDNYHVFAIVSYCRSAIPHPIVFDAGHVLRLMLGLILASVLTGRRLRISRRVYSRGLRLSHRER
jgi:hypothetical protein